MKWQDAAKLLIAMLLVAGAVTYSDLFGVLFQLNGVNATYSGDITCADTCESYINVTTSYWRVCFEHPEDSQRIYIPGKSKLEKSTIGDSPETVLYKKSTRGRTLWVNLNNVDNIISTAPTVPVDWKVPTYGDNWRDIRDGDCWDRGKVNKIKLVGHKQPQETVKWGFNTGDYVNIDPVWEGLQVEKIYINHTENHCPNETEEYDYINYSECMVNISEPYYRYSFNNITLTTPVNTLCYWDGSNERTCFQKLVIDYEYDYPLSLDSSMFKYGFQTNRFSDITIEHPSQLTRGNNTIIFKFKYPANAGEEWNLSFSNGFFDWNIDPDISACSVLNTSGATYTLTTNITDSSQSKCINITANNIIFDGGGHTIDSDDVTNYGIYVYRSSSETTNVTIKNVVLKDWSTAAINLEYGNGNVVDDVNISSCQNRGIYFRYSGNNNLTNTTVTTSYTAVSLYYSDNDIFDGLNTSYYNQYGISIMYSAGLVVNNTETKDNYIFDFHVSTMSDSDCDVELNNVTGTDNKPIVIYTSRVNLTNWNNNFSELILLNADNSNLTNITLNRTGTSNNLILLANTDNSKLKNIQVYNTENGVEVDNSNYNDFFNITVSDVDSSAFYIYSSDYNTVYNSSFTSSSKGVRLYSYPYHNTIKNNRIEGNDYGMYLGYVSTTNIYNNLFNQTSNYYVYVTAGADNYLNTTEQPGTRIYQGGSYTAPNIGGNYWTNPSGTGRSDTCTDSDNNGFCDDAYTLETYDVDYLPYSDEYMPYKTPRWSDDGSTGTVASSNVTFSVKWNSTDSAGSSMDSYIFYFHNGTNYSHNSVSSDLESGTQNIKGSPPGTGLNVFEDFESISDWTETCYGTTNSPVWNVGTSTPSSNTGPQSGDSDDAGSNFGYVETSSGYAYDAGDYCYLTYNTELDWSGNNKLLTFETNFYGATVGTMTLEENSSGSWVVTDYSQSGDDGNSGNTWTAKSADVSSLTGNGYIRFKYYKDTSGYTGDAAIDKLNITSDGSSDNDANKTPVTYSDVSISPYETLKNLTFTIYVSYYNNSGSVANSNTNPTLWLEVYNGTDWIDEGSFSVSSTGNHSIVVTTASVLSAWNETSNRDLRISARYVDYNDSTRFDTINWTGVWVEENSEGFYYEDSSVAFTSSDCTNSSKYVCWSNVTKILTSTVGANISWYVWANTTSPRDKHNETDGFSFLTTSSGSVDTNFTIWDGSSWVDYSLGTEYLTFACTPTQTDCEPENQNAGSSQSIFQVCNNGTADGSGVYMNVNETFTGISLKCDDDYTSAGAITLTTSNQTIHGALSSSSCVDISCWADYSNPTSGGYFDVRAYVYS